jgi:threonine dehydratase
MEEGSVDASGDAAGLIARIDPAAAHSALADGAIRTPALRCAPLQQAVGFGIALKAESLQTTGSFKLRGALSKIAALGERARDGVIAASAGNHARAVAFAARGAGIACEVVMPVDAAVSKVVAVQELGAAVQLQGTSVDDSLALAAQRARETGAALVHPFDDIDVIAGQGTVALELLQDVPDLTRIVVPVGGGGLAAGIGVALRRARAGVQLVGVQAQACAPYVDALASTARTAPRGAVAAGATIADGIAIKQPGELTLPLLAELLDDLDVVGEEEIARAIVVLAEHAKLVVEGAGAVAVASLLSGRLPAVAGTTVAIVSGGNIDSGLLAGLLARRETEAGRRVRMYTRVPDRPGGLAELLTLIARARANLVTVEHVREAVPLHVGETGVALTLQTRGREHSEEVVALLRAGGYDVAVE